MIESLIGLLFWLIVLVVFYWIGSLVVAAFSAPHVLLQIWGAILLLIFVGLLFQTLTGSGPTWPRLRLAP